MKDTTILKIKLDDGTKIVTNLKLSNVKPKKQKIIKQMRDNLFDTANSAYVWIDTCAGLARRISLFNVAANLEEVLVKLSEVDGELKKNE